MSAKRSTNKKGWVLASAVFLSGSFGREIKCPRCGHLSHTANAIHLCAKCYAKWRERADKYEFFIT